MASELCPHNLPMGLCFECQEIGEQMVNTITKILDDLDKKENPCDRNRPYDGQPHTDQGERGKTLIVGLTMRDIFDCFVKGWLHASGRSHLVEANACDYRDVYKGEEVDPLAVAQNMMCEVERMMGIFPNVPKLEQEAPNDRRRP